MVTGTLKSQVDRLWEEFWTGGISNPLTVIEQISFLAFIRLLDIRETLDEKKWNRSHPGEPFEGMFGPKQQELRWSRFTKLGSGDVMLALVRDKVFPFIRTLGAKEGTFADHMKDAQLLIQRPSLLVSATAMIEKLPLTGGDTKGDIYEYMLSRLSTAGVAGQFRTPIHIIRMIVGLVDPKPTETVVDPACGTGGFLVGVMNHLKEKYTSPAGRIPESVEGEDRITLTSDMLSPEERKHVNGGMFTGFDFDATMLRIAAMNLMLHGVDAPAIRYQDTLSTSFTDKYPDKSADHFDVVLANPPFKGSLDASDVHPTLGNQVKTKKTELLFVVLILRLLRLGGRAGVIVPDGVLFGSSNAHVALRKILLEENQLDAVVKLPSGVFKPYAGVATAVLFFTKGGRTEKVWFYDVQADGFSLDDKRDPVAENDLPDVELRWNKRNPKKDTDRKQKAFYVPKADIVAQNYDLSLNRYKEVVHEETTYDSPKVILKRLKKLEAEIAKDLEELEAML